MKIKVEVKCPICGQIGRFEKVVGCRSVSGECCIHLDPRTIKIGMVKK